MTSAISTKMFLQVMLMVIIKSTHKNNLNRDKVLHIGGRHCSHHCASLSQGLLKVYLQSFIVLASLLYPRKMEYQVSFTDIDSVKPVAVIG